MGRTKFTSPTLTVRITAAQCEAAVKSASGACLIADAIKKQYPQYTSVSVDMATIRFSDRKAGVRYVYLTPPSAQHVLLSFDQGWPNPIEEIVIKRAVQIMPITATTAEKQKAQAERLAELEALEALGEELTKAQKMTLTKLRNAKYRPTSRGKAEVKVGAGGHVVVSGGRSLVQGKAHPNLLRSRNRHFGAKLAEPGEAFQAAVDAAVAERLSETTT